MQIAAISNPGNIQKFVLLTLFVSFLFTMVVLATEMEIRPGVTGIWLQPEEKEDPHFRWNSHWIWMDENTNSDMMLARQVFDLSETPKEAVIRITASSKYQLFINGEYMCQGPARSAPHHQSYDILDISDLLHDGKNLIAVRVHHQKGKFSYHHDDRAGFLAQLDFSSHDQKSAIITDPKWKVSADFS